MANLTDVRYGFQSQLNDPKTRNAFYALTNAETGGQGLPAQQAFMETVFNRAAARGQTLPQAIYDRNYYPKQTFDAMGRGVPAERTGQMGALLDAVIGGSDLTKGGTGNASGSVMFAGGPQTLATGGERFGVEGPDRGWQNRAQPAPNPYGPEGLNEAGPNGPQDLSLLKFGSPDAKAVPPGEQGTAGMMALGGPKPMDANDDPRLQNRGGINPLVMMGLGLLGSGMEGKGYAQGLLGGANAAQGFDHNRINEMNSERGWAVKQRELQLQQQQDALVRTIGSDPAFAKIAGPDVSAMIGKLPAPQASALVSTIVSQKQAHDAALVQARLLQQQKMGGMMDIIRMTAPGRQQTQSSVPTFGAGDKAKVDALPSGSRYIGPDGQMREKP